MRILVAVIRIHEGVDANRKEGGKSALGSCLLLVRVNGRRDPIPTGNLGGKDHIPAGGIEYRICSIQINQKFTVWNPSHVSQNP